MAGGHQVTQELGCCIGRIEQPGNLAAEHHCDAVGKAQHLFELCRNQQDGHAPIPRVDKLAMNELGRADIHAPRRLRSDEQSAPTREFAGNDYLLLIAARERTRQNTHRARTDVEFLRRALREAHDRLAYNPEALRKWRTFVAA